MIVRAYLELVETSFVIPAKAGIPPLPPRGRGAGENVQSKGEYVLGLLGFYATGTGIVSRIRSMIDSSIRR